MNFNEKISGFIKIVDKILDEATPHEAIQYIKKQLKNYSNNKVITTHLYIIMGDTYYSDTNYTYALDSYIKARNYAYSKRSSILIQTYIAGVYLGLKDYEQALRAMDEPLKYYQNKKKIREKKDFLRYIDFMIYLALVYIGLNKPDKAKEVILKKIKPNEAKMSEYSILGLKHILGEYYLQIGDVNKSIVSFRESIGSAKKLGVDYYVITGHIHIAEIRIRAKKYNEALALLLPFTKRKYEKYISLYIEILFLISRIYDAMSDQKTAAKIINKSRKFVKQADPLWIFNLNKDHNELFAETKEVDYIRSKIPHGTIIKTPVLEQFNIIGKNKEFVKSLASAIQVAKTDLNVLIEGETGTGKELFARAIHYASNRSGDNFLPINCGGLPESIMETELFGYKKGSFTGADRDRKGLFEVVSGGTIFLDECSEMSPTMQKNLLRVLEEKKIRPVGGHKYININARFIFGSNKSLQRAVDQGLFREDLFYRINVFSVILMPLRERKDDIALLISHFIKMHTHPPKNIKIKKNALKLLENYNWQGNIRELENEIKRILSIFPNINNITADMLSPKIKEYYNSPNIIEKTAFKSKKLKDIEKEFIIAQLKLNNGNVSKTAKLIGMSRMGLARKIKRLGIHINKSIQP